MSVTTIIGGFLISLISVIGGNVLFGRGLLLMAATIEKVQKTIKTGRNMKISEGCSSVEITSNKTAEQT